MLCQEFQSTFPELLLHNSLPRHSNVPHKKEFLIVLNPMTPKKILKQR